MTIQFTQEYQANVDTLTSLQPTGHAQDVKIEPLDGQTHTTICQRNANGLLLKTGQAHHAKVLIRGQDESKPRTNPQQVCKSTLLTESLAQVTNKTPSIEKQLKQPG